MGRTVLSRQDQPHPSAPPVQKIRLRYAKQGRMRFSSHRDLARAFEWALRRAGVPMAYSQGFSPHPKISWSPAVPTGVASVAEYVELQLVERVDPAVLRAELDAMLPDGFDVLEAVQAGAGSLADQLEASRWWIELPGIDPADLRAAVSRLLAADRVEVQRMTKNGRRAFDVRGPLVSAEVRGAPEEAPGGTAGRDVRPASTARVDDWPKGARPYGILEAVVRQTTPVVRPDDVLNALRVVADLAPPAVVRATRREQGRLDDGGALTEPLAQDRVTARG